MNMYEGRSAYVHDRRVYMWCENPDERVCTCPDELIRYQIHRGKAPAVPVDSPNLLWEQLPRDRDSASVKVEFDEDSGGWAVGWFLNGGRVQPLSVKPYPSADCALDAVFGGPTGRALYRSQLLRENERSTR